MEKTKQNNSLILFVAIAFVCVCVVVLLVAQGDKNKKPAKQAANPFAKCQVLSDSCKDKSCDFLFLCNATEFSDCRVYDCGDKYGVSILDKQGKTKDEFREKLDQAKAQEMIAKCSGLFEVIEKNNCDGNQATAKIKLNTQGNCKVVSATMAIDGKSRIASVKQDGKFYVISVKSCGEISNVKITGESGVAIREKVEVLEESVPHEN